MPEDTAVAYANLDKKGRLPLNKPFRESLGLSEGSTVAFVKVGDALMVIPQDAHVASLVEQATAVLQRAKITVDDLLEALPQARDEVVTEHYGAGFFDSLRREAKESAQVATRR